MKRCNVTHFWMSVAILCAHSFLKPCVKYAAAADEMEDFPLDADETDNNSDQTIDLSSLHESSDGDGDGDDHQTSEFDGKLDGGGGGGGGLASVGNRIAAFNQIMAAAMKKPAAKQRLAQVLPIIRAMSPTQRLTLATLVLKQLSSSKSAQPMVTYDHWDQLDNKTAELMLPISADIAAMFYGLKKDAESGRSTAFGTYYYNPLSAGYRVGGPQRPVFYNIRRFQAANSRKKDDVPPEMMPPPYTPSANVSYANFNKRPQQNDEPVAIDKNEKPRDPAMNDDERDDERDDNESDADQHEYDAETANGCEPSANNLCLEITSYPSKEIVDSIKNLEQKHVFRALVEDFVNNVTVENPEIERRLSSEKKENTLQLCASKIKYARPKKAKSMNGNWKFVVNTDHYTQTVRIETCLYADKACSFLNENVKSHCVQIYNYHRLLTWDEKSGLSLDLFKIPSCCSCQIQHLSPFSTIKHSPKPDQALQDNVIVDESSIVHTPLVKPKLKNKLNIPYSNLKRDSSNRPRRPQQPILPIHFENNEFMPPTRYSATDNSIRRTSGKTNILKSVYVPGKGTFTEYAEPESTTIPRRVNYNYHPIIDFFRSTPPQAIDRADLADEWLPMTEGPRSIKTRR